MTRRLQKTLLDYLIIAISPALIIALVESLVFFLLVVFYQGNFQAILNYIFGLFVIGAVLTARISIEEGRERAMLFTIPLGLVTLLALNKYVRFQDETLASMSFFINLGLIVLILWSSDRLTWDCTLIDESEEDSGEGLLETVGLDRPDRAAIQKEITPAATEPEATTSRETQPIGWWERYLERRRRPHAPGVWVIYFSLAALPLFGIGQIFIPADNLPSRQYAFKLLFVYTACGLGLLLSTSFLGLRRYLRQRRQEMPLLMVNVWLWTGGVLIVGVMFMAMLLPRPNPEYAISELPFKVGSPQDKELKSSRFGRGREGVDEKKPWTRGEKSEGKSSVQSQGDNKSDAKRDSSGNESGNNSDPAKTDSAESKKSDQTEKDSAEGKISEGKSSDRSAGEKKSETAKPAPSKTDKPTPQPNHQSQQKAQPERQEPQRRETQHPSQTRDKSAGELMVEYHPVMQYSSDILQLLAMGLKWMIYWVLGMVGVYWLWTQRDKILSAINNMGQWLIDLWNSLFGGKVHYEEGDAEQPGRKIAPPRRFADFTDPFALGTAGSFSPEELVRYTFEALEAWALDRGQPRLPDQTPHEFARALGAQVTSLADDAGRLAELYCQAAYAHGTLPPKSAARLAHVWQTMRAEPAPASTNDRSPLPLGDG